MSSKRVKKDGFSGLGTILKLKISALPNLVEKCVYERSVCVCVVWGGGFFPSSLFVGLATILLNDLYSWGCKNQETKSGMCVINKVEQIFNQDFQSY